MDIGEDVIIEEGLSGGEQIIVEGLQRVHGGMPAKATPMPATLEPTKLGAQTTRTPGMQSR